MVIFARPQQKTTEQRWSSPRDGSQMEWCGRIGGRSGLRARWRVRGAGHLGRGAEPPSDCVYHGRGDGLHCRRRVGSGDRGGCGRAQGREAHPRGRHAAGGCGPPGRWRTGGEPIRCRPSGPSQSRKRRSSRTAGNRRCTVPPGPAARRPVPRLRRAGGQGVDPRRCELPAGALLRHG